jgi:CheY-like chemotaxis protein
MKEKAEILVVDNDADFRAILGEVFKAEGCSVREATNGCQALEMARAHVPDLIVTDLMMPAMNGWELCAELRRNQRLAQVPVAVVSGVGPTGPSGVRALSKPVELPALLALVESLLAG